MIALPDISEIKQAAKLLQAKGMQSALLPAHDRLFLKTDCKLAGGSYKMRGVEYFANQMTANSVQVLSAGNLALAAALRLSQNDIHCEAVVPEGISQIKRDKLTAAGASITAKPFSEIWDLVLDHELRQSKQFLHPFNKYLLAGYASIILELHHQGFKHGSLVVPYGLGGLAVALAHAIDATKSHIKLYLCEIASAAPFTRALQANHPVTGDKLQSFIEAMGTPVVIADVFTYLQPRIAGVIQVTEEDVKHEIHAAYHQYQLRLEGAAGASLAAAKKLHIDRPVIALMTGENISDSIFREIISGHSLICRKQFQ